MMGLANKPRADKPAPASEIRAAIAKGETLEADAARREAAAEAAMEEAVLDDGEHNRHRAARDQASHDKEAARKRLARLRCMLEEAEKREAREVLQARVDELEKRTAKRARTANADLDRAAQAYAALLKERVDDQVEWERVKAEAAELGLQVTGRCLDYRLHALRSSYAHVPVRTAVVVSADGTKLFDGARTPGYQSPLRL